MISQPTNYIDTSCLFEKKEEIRCFIQRLLNEKGKDTNYVNKRMQDSIVNFFLEDYVAPLFSINQTNDSFTCRKQLHKNILNHIRQKKALQGDVSSASTHKNPKYVQLLCEYLELLTKENLLREYQQMLIKTILMEESDNKEHCLTLLWRKQLCILLIENSMNPQLNNIYLMWNASYPQNPIYNKKESFYRKNLKQKKTENTRQYMQSVQSSSSLKIKIHPIVQKQKSSFEEESLMTETIAKQEYVENQDQSCISGTLSTELRSPRSNSCMKQTESQVESKVVQKRAGILSLHDCHKKHISFNFEILQYMNSELSNQTFLSSSIIYLQ